MTDRTHWQFCLVIDPDTLQVEECGAYIGNVELGIQTAGRWQGKLIVLLCEVKTRSIQDTKDALAHIILTKYPWVREKFLIALQGLVDFNEYVKLTGHIP